MKPVHFLIDTSALIRVLRVPSALSAWDQQITAGLVATCPITELELLFTVKSAADRREQLEILRDTFSWVVMPDNVFQRANEVQAALTESGAHRSAGPVDLLAAAAAESHGLTLLHYDADFAQVSRITGQPAQWIAEPGSID